MNNDNRMQNTPVIRDIQNREKYQLPLTSVRGLQNEKIIN
jgi:hypothetical protein